MGDNSNHMNQIINSEAKMQQHLVQQHLLEEHFKKNRLLMYLQQEGQLPVIKPQDQVTKEHLEQLRIHTLKNKDEISQSAVASPEVKRRLQEVILQRKLKDAAASMGNLRTGIPLTSTATAPPAPPSMLRKVQSESNLLKIKNRRGGGERSAGPYSRQVSNQLKLVPEYSGSNDSTPSPQSAKGILLHSAQGGRHSSPEPGSPSSPISMVLKGSPLKVGGGPLGTPPSHSALLTGTPPNHPAHLALMTHPYRCSPTDMRQDNGMVGGGGIRHPVPLTANSSSRSLPNIPSTLEGRNRSSPPIRGPQSRTNKHFFGRSHSTAILPLRKHLIEKSLAEKRSVDDNQYDYQQSKLDRERLTRSLLIKPLEEVMEEETSDLRVNNSSSHLGQDFSLTKNVAQEHKIFLRQFHAAAGTSPLVTNGVSSTGQDTVMEFTSTGGGQQDTSGQTGLGFDGSMLKHQCICENKKIHPENPERLQAILSHLLQTGIIQNCQQVSEIGSLEMIRSCHTDDYTLLFGTDVIKQRSAVGQDLQEDGILSKFVMLPCGGLGVDSDTYWNEHYTATAARYAVGSAVALAKKIATEELKNGFALVRPPGHHAEADEAMGFCYFNTVAIAAKQLLELGSPQNSLREINRILIVDWAIHHGNGTQKMFYEDPRVLYISIHRHDNGNFYPGTGSSIECGNREGLGFNVNIAWSGGLAPPMGDAEYLAAFRSIVMPIARSFNPDFVLVSAGFDAAIGHQHPIGGYEVSTACFAFLTHQLMALANGRVQLVLEGGYHTGVLADCAEQCCRALMGGKIAKICHEELERRPCKNAVETLQKTLAIQTQYWPILSRYTQSATLSHLETWEKEREEMEALSAMAGLSMYHQALQQQEQ